MDFSRTTLELVDLILRIPQLLQDTRVLPLVLRALLLTTDRLVQPRRPAHKNLYILLLWLRQHRLEHILCNVALALLPPLWRIVEDVKRAEASRVRIFELVELLTEQNILFGNVAKDERNLCIVVGVVEDAPHYLVHGRDAGAAGNHGDVVVLVGLPFVFWEGAFDFERVARFEGVDVLGHGAVGVLLYH